MRLQARGESQLSGERDVKRRPPENDLNVILSQREYEVLQWVAEGKTNFEISILLNIALRTVEKHCENIYKKLGVENRIAAAREWLIPTLREGGAG